MNGIDPLAASASLPTSLRTTSEVLDELYFKPVVHLGAGCVSGANLLGTLNVPVVEHPVTGAITSWRWNHYFRPRWARSGVLVDLDYTAPGGSTNNFFVQVIIRAWAAGDNLGAITTRGTATFTVPGPAVANDILTARQVIAAPALPTSATEVAVILLRNDAHASDVNGNSLYVTSLRLEFTSGGA